MEQTKNPDNEDIVVLWTITPEWKLNPGWKLDTAVIHALNTFDLEKIVPEGSEIFSAKPTGYPLLFHIMESLFNKEMKGKKILEIGWGVSYGLQNIQYLRKLTDTIKNGTVEHHAYGIDLRNEYALFSKVFQKVIPGNLAKLNEEKRRKALSDLKAIWSNAIRAWDWADIAKLKDNNGSPLTFDCIFHHSIGPNPSGYEKVTDAALNPGGFYIAFRGRESRSPEPVDKQYFIDHKYYDGSFSFEFRKRIKHNSNSNNWYDVTIFRKPFQSGRVMWWVQDDTNGILAG